MSVVNLRLLSFGRRELPHGAESFVLETSLPHECTPRRLIVPSFLPLQHLSLQLEWLKPPVDDFAPAELFSSQAFWTAIQRVRVPAGQSLRLHVNWRPPRQLIWRPRIPKWRGAWWVTHTRLPRQWFTAIVEVEL